MTIEKSEEMQSLVEFSPYYTLNIVGLGNQKQILKEKYMVVSNSWVMLEVSMAH